MAVDTVFFPFRDHIRHRSVSHHGWVSPLTRENTVTVASAVNAPPYPDQPRVTITLKRDTRQRLGKLDIIYRGVKNRELRLDVFILDLDPQYAYRHAIALDQA
jgi:hypothetical protein